MDGQEKILSVCWSEAPVKLLLLCNAPLEVERGKLVGYVLSGNFCKASGAQFVDFSAIKASIFY